MSVELRPQNEEERLEKLHRYRILDTMPEEAFDRIARVASQTLDVPIALVNLIDRDRLWSKAQFGLTVTEMPRDISFCTHVILKDEVMVVEDMTQDRRFADNPFVTAESGVRFYAGAPMRTPDGFSIGTLCALDRQPRRFSAEQRQLLADLANMAMDAIELRVALRRSLKDIEDQRQLAEMQSNFIAMISHELRTPLTSVRGTLALLQGGALGTVPEKAQKLIATANRNAVNLARLIDDLLDMQKIEAGQMVYDFQPVDVPALLAETVDNLSVLAEARRIDLTLSCQAAYPVTGDPARLQQAIANLIANALKFSPDGGTVTVRAAAADAAMQIAVEDRGKGIPPEIGPAIFQKFIQARPSDSGKGTGLGLAIAKAIVEAHQGRIWFESTPDISTIFHIELPLRRSAV